MDTSDSTPKLIKWKYFRTSLVMYLLFYLLPIFLLFFIARDTAFMKLAQIVGVSWVIGGNSLIAAIAAYSSKGVAFLEPSLASVATLVLAMLALLILDYLMYSVLKSLNVIRDIICPIVTFFLLALFGAWIGGRFQKFSKKASYNRINMFGAPDQRLKSQRDAFGTDRMIMRAIYIADGGLTFL